ncbi:hypothetical protein J7L67_02030 [bacterium]|nr:hypothetical protein [bacterium]
MNACNELSIFIDQGKALEYLNDAQSMIAESIRRNIFTLKNFSDISVLPPICHEIMEVWLIFRAATGVKHINQTEYYHAWIELTVNLSALIDTEDGTTMNKVLQLIKDVRIKRIANSEYEVLKNEFIRDAG